MRQILSLLEEKQRQVESLRRQLAEEREGFRRQVEEIQAQWEEVAAARQEALTERDRLREFRIRFLHRLRRHWRQARRQADTQQHELERQRRLLDEERARWQRQFHETQHEREAFLAERQRWIESSRQTEAQLTRQLADLARRNQEFEQREAALRNLERQLEAERGKWTAQLDNLRMESRGLEQRISAARRLLAIWSEPSPPTPDNAASSASHDSLQTLLAEVPLPYHADLQQYYQRCQQVVIEQWATLADQRRHLAELWQRLAKAQEDWQEEQQLAILDMERLCSALRVEEEQLKARARDLEIQAHQWRAQHEEWQRQRQRWENEQAHSQCLQIEARAEAARREFEYLRRANLLEKREKSLAALFRRWRDRRREEVMRWRRAMAECVAARDAWDQARDEYIRRIDSLRISQQALAEQAIALEEVKQQLRCESADPSVFDRRIERHRRRWEQAGKQAARALEQYRRQLAEEDAELRQIFLELEKQQESLLRAEREVNQRRSELEQQQREWQCREQELAAERVHWITERDILRQQIADLQAELQQRLTASEGPTEDRSSRAAA